MFERLKIEDSILGAIIYHNGYPQIAHILSPANFSDLPETQNRGLYSIITGLFPGKPIDLLSISYEIRTKYPHNVALMSTLINAGQKVCTATSIVHWAFMLLQIDITTKFQYQLAEWRSEREADHDHTEAGALLEIYETLSADADIFNVIDGAVDYFKHLNMQKELNASVQFYNDLSTKVSNTKKMTSINTALSYVFDISNASPQVSQTCQALADAIAIMIINNDVKPEYIQAANLINK